MLIWTESFLQSRAGGANHLEISERTFQWHSTAWWGEAIFLEMSFPFNSLQVLMNWIKTFGSFFVSPSAPLWGHLVDVPVSGRCCIMDGFSSCTGTENLVHLQLVMPGGTPRWSQSCSSLKLIASIPFPRTQLHLSSLFAGSKSSPSSRECKTKHCFQGSLCQQLSDASQSDTKWAVEGSPLWVGPCVPYIKLLNVRHSTVQVRFAAQAVGQAWDGAELGKPQLSKDLLPVLWAGKKHSSSEQDPPWQTAHPQTSASHW